MINKPIKEHLPEESAKCPRHGHEVGVDLAPDEELPVRLRQALGLPGQRQGQDAAHAQLVL